MKRIPTRSARLFAILMLCLTHSAKGADEQHIYATGESNVFRIALDGQSAVYAELPGSNRGLDMDCDGALWVLSGEALYRIEPGFHNEPAKLANGRVRKITEGIRKPLGMAVAPDGRLWIAEQYHGFVILNPTTKSKTYIEISKNGGIAYGAESGPDGLMYLSRQGKPTITRYRQDSNPADTADGAPVPFISGYGQGHRSIVFLPGGRMLMIREPEISIFDADGHYKGPFFKWQNAQEKELTREEFIARGMVHPMDLAIDADGVVYSTDWGYRSGTGRVGGAVYRYDNANGRELLFEAPGRMLWIKIWPERQINPDKPTAAKEME